jgi:hypothetical protein
MEIINVFWTGGWDSTFRVLQLALLENRTVRPYYGVDPHRQSIANEIIAMTRIRHRLKADFPAQAARLLPVEMIDIEEAPPDAEISRWYQQLAAQVHISKQYEGLARFAKYNVAEPELCIEKMVGIDRVMLFRDFVRPFMKGKGHECHIEGPFSEPAIEMFKYFRFPIAHLTKGDMRIISEEQGFLDIMKLTWFCQRPVKGQPCGKCRPCLMAPSSGLEYTFYQPNFSDKINVLGKRFLRRKT